MSIFGRARRPLPTAVAISGRCFPALFVRQVRGAFVVRFPLRLRPGRAVARARGASSGGVMVFRNET